MEKLLLYCGMASKTRPDSSSVLVEKKITFIEFGFVCVCVVPLNII